MTAAHRAAVKALLAACTIAGYPGGQVIDEPTFPYWVLFMATGNDAQTKLCRTTDKITIPFQVNSVGMTDDAAQIVSDKTWALLSDVRPTVAGWSCDPIRRVMSIPLQQDKDVTIPSLNLHPMFAVDSYELVSRKD